MPETQNGQAEEVLTLAEAAAFLRVPEDEVQRLAENRQIPAQQIGSAWRLSKSALSDWLRYGREYVQELRRWPWMLDQRTVEELLFLLEKRLLDELQAERKAVEPGTKQAVLRHFGVFKDDDDLQEVLAGLHARRKAGGE